MSGPEEQDEYTQRRANSILVQNAFSYPLETRNNVCCHP